MSEFQQTKTWLVDTLHLSRDALHIYVALLVFFGACLLFRWKASEWKPWLCVLAAAVCGEAWDLWDTLRADDDLELAAGLKDLWNTMLAPTLLMLLARYSAVFRSPPGGAAR